MESKIRQQEPIFLSYTAKKIGLVLMLAAILVRLLPIPITAASPEWLRRLPLDVLLLGLLLVAWSKDRVEDEMTIFIRLKAIVWAFTIGVMTVIFTPFVSSFFGESPNLMTAEQVVMSILVIYLIRFYAEKWRR